MDLTDEQDALVAQMQAITECEESVLVQNILRMNDWNLERAISSFFEMDEETRRNIANPASSSPPAAPVPPPRPPARPPTPAATRPPPGPRPATGILHALSRMFLPILYFTRPIFNAVAPLIARYLPARVSALLASLFQLHVQCLPDATSADLVPAYERQFGSSHPEFFTGLYSDAVTRARANFQFLVVYLHSAAHYNTASFCKETLGNPALQTYLNSNFTFYVADVNQVTGERIAAGMEVTDYPTLVVLDVTNRPTLVHRIEGFHCADRLQVVLNQILETRGATLVAARLDREEREQERILRRQQEEEYEQVVQQEREREAREEAERERVAREAEEAEQRLADAKEAEARAEQEAVLEAQRKEQERKERRESLPAEPASDEPDSTKLAIRLPNGVRLQRHFRATDTIQLVKDYVDTADTDMDTDGFYLVSTHPRKVYDTLEQTLGDAGLVPKAMLLLEPLTKQD